MSGQTDAVLDPAHRNDYSKAIANRFPIAARVPRGLYGSAQSLWTTYCRISRAADPQAGSMRDSGCASFALNAASVIRGEGVA